MNGKQAKRIRRALKAQGHVKSDYVTMLEPIALHAAGVVRTVYRFINSFRRAKNEYRRKD